MQPRAVRYAIFATAVLGASAALAGCGLGQGNARETMPPLPAPGNGVMITQPPAGPSQTAAPPTAPGGSIPTDDADPTSVASRFLDAAAIDDTATGAALEAGASQPTVFEWAQGIYESTVDVAGEAAWGVPNCAEPEGTTVRCTWLANDPSTSLVLVQSGSDWKVSHPLRIPPDDAGTDAGRACVVGNAQVRLRGGPGTDWPFFQLLQPGRCNVTLRTTVAEGPDGPWRYVSVDGVGGWVVDRVLQAQG